MPLPWSLPFNSSDGELAATDRADRVCGRGGARGNSPSWRERWSARLVLVAFACGVLLAASADYLTNHLDTPDGGPVSPGDPTGVKRTRRLRHRRCRPFGPSTRHRPWHVFRPRNKTRPPRTGRTGLAQSPINGLKLVGVRAMPGEQGQMLCAVFFTRGRSSRGNLSYLSKKHLAQARKTRAWRATIPRPRFIGVRRGQTMPSPPLSRSPSFAHWPTQRVRRSGPSTANKQGAETDRSRARTLSKSFT